MINFLSSWVKNLSLALIIVSILEMILPNSKIKKYIKMVMGIYILFNIISPFIENSNNFNLENINLDLYSSKTEQVYSDEVDQTSMNIRLNDIYKKKLEEDITKKLTEKNFIVENCKVNTKIYIEDSNSEIERITLKIKKREVNLKENKTIEDKIVSEIENIKKVEIKVSEDSDNEENNIEKKLKSLNKEDIEEIKKFLINEYGVSEKCLKIN